MLRILHTADWHLGRRFPTFSEEAQRTLSRARMEAISRILDLGRRNQVNAILCAGDLFDDPSPSEDFWEGLAKTLRDHPGPHVPIFLVPGNHDPLTSESVWAGSHPFRSRVPNWVHVVDRDDFSYELSPDAVLYASPCRSKAGEHDLALALPARDAGDKRIRIGCVHGCTFDLKGFQTNFPISRDAGVQRGLDYLAIGDTHSFRDVTDRSPVPTVYPGSPEPTNFDEPGAGSVALVAFFRHGMRPRVAAEPVGYWRWLDVHCRDMHQLRTLLTIPELQRHVVRLRLDMAVTLSEDNEVGRIVRELQGTEAAHGRAGIVLVDKTDLQLQPGSANIFPEDLPPVVRDTIARLDKLIEDAEDEAEKLRATRALGHLYRLLQTHEELGEQGAMKILRLRVTDFAAIREADIDLGRGLNVLYGPNDLGKSTLAEAIRLALLLPHTSSHIDEYVPWTGGQSPVVELTFETEAQRIWRVRKEFRKGGAATLLESRDNKQFDEVERARGVDGRLREILKWGIPEPGGTRGAKGLPTSFLATALLSTQADVTAVLSESLSGDPSGTGKERIAAALQAVAQDPLFAALLKETQARRDQAYTEKGEKKRAKGSVLKEAADRVRATREDVELWQKQVDDSGAIETTLHQLADRRDQAEEAVSAARDRLAALEEMAKQAAAVLAAERHELAARQDVERIQRIDEDITTSKKKLAGLAGELSSAEQAAKDGREGMAAAAAALQAVEKDAIAAGPDAASADTVARQALELRRAAAQQAAAEAQRRIDALDAIRKLVEASVRAATDYRELQTEANAAHAVGLEASERERAATAELQRLDLLEGALEARRADEQVDVARRRVDEKAMLEGRLASANAELEGVAARRAGITVPLAASVPSMRQLETELAGARGALNVGLTVTVVPRRPIDVTVSKDGEAPDPSRIDGTLEIEANASLDLTIGDVADVEIRGGRREAQAIVRSLEQRWTDDVAPHLAAAGVDDLARLTARVAEAQALDADVKLKESELQTLRQQLASFGDPAEELRQASAARMALGSIPLEALASNLTELGSDPVQTLRGERQKAAAALEAARSAAATAGTNQTVANERSRASKARLDQASAVRDAELSRFPSGLPAELTAAQSSMKAVAEELKAVATELMSLERIAAERKARIDAGLAKARPLVAREHDALDAAAATYTQVRTGYDREAGSLETLRERRKLEDLEAATRRLEEASTRRRALPVPSEMVTEAKVAEGRAACERAQNDLTRILGDIHKAHGALEQVGGAVARERLRDAVEAFDQAERHEREVEAEYDAWNLLLEQMKQADADQASNLGQVLAPVVAKNFETLTQKRYEDVRLSAQLGTEGVVAAGGVRATERLSIGTREQLSTLYRLSLAEYLSSAVVLDDQLVQSDNPRMEWFRALLAEKAHSFQIVVFTCRPGDYLAPGATVPKGKAVHKDTDSGFVRAIDLDRAVTRR